MGAWDTDTLSNDPAQDYLLKLEDASDRLGLIRKTLRRSAETEGTIAACEAVAAAGGFPAPQMNKEQSAYLTSVSPTDLADITRLSIEIVARVRTTSDLAD